MDVDSRVRFIVTTIQPLKFLSSLYKLGANRLDIRLNMRREDCQIHNRHHVRELPNYKGRRIEPKVDTVRIDKLAG